MKSAIIGKASLVALMASAGVLAASSVVMAAAAQPTEWKAWGGDNARNHFSTLTQITPANVAQLKPVWVYDPGTTGRGWENTPLLIDGMLYISDAYGGDIVALEPETGKEIWRWKAPQRTPRVRGLTYWAGDGGAFKPRILVLRGGRVQGLDIKTGQLIPDWGFSVSLPGPQQAPAGEEGAVAAPGGGSGGLAGQGVSRAQAGGGGGGGGGGTNASPALVVGDKLIVANSAGFRRAAGAPGDPRAYDLKTGKLLWRTRLIPGPNEPGGDSWGPNTQSVTGGGSWGILTADEKTNTVYVPTDSAAPDYVGIWRPGDNKWANSTVAIDADTGKIKWAFQTHHHDLFDWDNMAAPTITEITRNGEKIPLVVQTTKLGMMWIFDARNGKPLHGFEERPVPKSMVPGEQSSPTQPFTLGPPPLGRMTISRDTLSKLSPEANATCTAIWDREKLQNAGPFTPPFPEGVTVYLPGSSGAINWGGATINPDLGLAITNVTNIPVMNRLAQDGNPAEGNNGWRAQGNFTRFADKFGRPCIDGRHGELIAVQLATGKIAWRVPLGTLEDEYGEAGKASGATNIGPSLATRSGLIFIGATADERFRAFDAKTGKELWQTRMSASGVAGPMTYMGKDGRQYVVIAAGGPGTAAYLTNPQWGYRQTLVAFALPRPSDKPIDIVGPYPKRMPNPGERWDPQ